MIIDTHVHIGEMINFNMPEQMVIESMDKYHIDFSLVSNVQSAEYDHQMNMIDKKKQVSQEYSFSRGIKFAREYPDKIGLCPWIKPATEHADKKFIQMIKDNRDLIYAIKIHPFHSKMAPDDERMIPYIELAREFKLPIVTHTGGCEEARSIHVYNVAKKYPDINFVMVHLDLGTDNCEAIKLLGELPNLYGDTTWVRMESIIDAVKKYGSSKIVFGSDNPIDGLDTYHNNPLGDICIYQDYFNKLEGIIGKENYEDIMYRNAIKLFNIQKFGEV